MSQLLPPYKKSRNIPCSHVPRLRGRRGEMGGGAQRLRCVSLCLAVLTEALASCRFWAHLRAAHARRTRVGMQRSRVLVGPEEEREPLGFRTF